MELVHSYIAGLVKKVCNGDSTAFAELYTLTADKVKLYTNRYLRDDFLAEDALQEIYILAYKNINKLNDPSLFVAWLNQISFRVCFDMDKKRKGEALDTNSELLEEIEDTYLPSDPEKTAIKSDEERRLNLAIEKLAPLEKQLIVLRYYNGNKIEDIVTLTGLSKSTVKRHLNAAIDDLRSFMAQRS